MLYQPPVWDSTCPNLSQFREPPRPLVSHRRHRKVPWLGGLTNLIVSTAPRWGSGVGPEVLRFSTEMGIVVPSPNPPSWT